MRPSGSPDCFVVVNGPEDGTEFPVTSAPFYIGRDSGCAVNIRLDSAVPPTVAHVSAVSGGYRVRSADGAGVFVDGRRAGTVRSRMLRDGGMVRVGHTVLVLDCAADGLASRSWGVGSESDLLWAGRQGVKSLCGAFRWMVGLLLRMAGPFARRWRRSLVIGVVLLCLVYPRFRYTLYGLFLSLYYRVAHAIQGLLQQIPQ